MLHFLEAQAQDLFLLKYYLFLLALSFLNEAGLESPLVNIKIIKRVITDNTQKNIEK